MSEEYDSQSIHNSFPAPQHPDGSDYYSNDNLTTRINDEMSQLKFMKAQQPKVAAK